LSGRCSSGASLRGLIICGRRLSGLSRLASAATTATSTAASSGALFESKLFLVSSTGRRSAFSPLALSDRVVDADAVGHIRSGHTGAAGSGAEVGPAFKQCGNGGRMVLLNGPH